MRLPHSHHHDPKVDRLASVPLFQSASHDALEHLASIVDEADCPAAYTLIAQGSRHYESLVIVSGGAEVLVDGEVVNTIKPGEMIGEVSLLAPGLATATIRTTEPTSLLVIPHNQFEQVLDEVPSLAKHMAIVLAARLRSMDDHYHG